MTTKNLDELNSSLPDGFTIDKNTISEFCNDQSKFVVFLNTIIDIIDKNKLLTQDIKNKIQNYISKYTNIYFNSCKKTFCLDTTDNSLLTLSCDQYKTFINDTIDLKNSLLPILEKIPDLINDDIKEILSSINNINDICSLIDTLGNIDKVIEIMYSFTKTHDYDDFIKSLLICICPTSYSPSPSKSTEIPIYNSEIIYIFILILLSVIIFMYIVVNIMYYINNNNIESRYIIKKSILTLLLLILLGIIIFITLFFINPKCYFKNCLKKSNEWKPFSGNFKGSNSKFGVTVDVDVDLDINNNVKFNKLYCNGKLCPINDILSKCDDYKFGKVDINTKKDEGYQVISGCVDKMYEFKNSDGSSIVKSILVQNLSNTDEPKLNVITILNGCLGNMCIKEFIFEIPLVKS